MVTIERRVGFVHQVNPGEVIVRIQQMSACSGCHAKEFCCSTDCADRDLKIETDSSQYLPGDKVIIEGADSIGRLAVLLSFVIPIIVFVASLTLSLKLWGLNEALSIFVSMGLLGLYYGLLYLIDPTLGKIMKFEITKAE